MTGDRVVALPGCVVPDGVAVRQDVVDGLQELLDRAKSGRLHAFAVAFVVDDGTRNCPIGRKSCGMGIYGPQLLLGLEASRREVLDDLLPRPEW